MGKLVIGPEGFVDLRREPPSTTVTVQGFTPEPPKPAKAPASVMEEPPAPLPEAPLPAIQKTAEGLQPSVAAPVKVERKTRPPVLKRISSADGHPCYVIVTKNQWSRLGRFNWTGTRNGKMYRRVTRPGSTHQEVLWLHREAARCNREDQFVGFRDLDERNCAPNNLIIFSSKEALREYVVKARAGQVAPATNNRVERKS